uniref:Uncharacterized protein n=1 Tax=Rhizophora mucronata TaxID=61149 RepID=A0A2P2IVX9_RHIMU
MTTRLYLVIQNSSVTIKKPNKNMFLFKFEY